MTRTIKVSEVRPGMEVQWTSLGITRRCTGEVVDAGSPRDGVNLRTSEGGAVHIPGDAEVTVLTESQPEEPTEFGARVRVRDGRFVRLDWVGPSSRPWHEKGTGYRWTWDDLCEMGPVTVIPDQGWTVPSDTPEVPDRIEEWPEDDEHLKDHKWRDEKGAIWSSWNGKWGYQAYGRKWRPLLDLTRPFDGPWTRVTDA